MRKIAIALEEILNPVKILKSLYGSNPLLSNYIKVFDDILEKETVLYNDNYNDLEKYLAALNEYKKSLQEKCNHNIDPNLFDIYKAEINLIDINLAKIKN